VTPGAVVDTNVMFFANGRSPEAGDGCVMRCVEALAEFAVERRSVLIDDRGLILEEYRRNLSMSGRPGQGDQFFKWLWDRQWNPAHCRRIAIAFHADRGFNEFPTDEALARFDPADRKFVAVVVASGESAPILAASDQRSWGQYREALKKHSVQVEFVCPELMEGRR
jgi:hypothetical protein